MTPEVAQASPAPRFLTASAGEWSSGRDGLTQTAELLRRPLRPWSEAVAEAALQRNGRWRYPLVTVSVPRQAGKTTFVATVAIDRCLRDAGTQAWYTAQSRTDAVARLADMAQLLDGSGLRRWTRYAGPREEHDGTWDYRLVIGAGNEAVLFANGSSLRVFAPKHDSLHGSVTDLVIIDEARFFDARLGAQLMAAALPTQVTRDGQVWVTSTAGGPESTWLADLMDRGRSGAGERMFYAEWGIADDVAEGDLLEAVWAAHPAAGMEGGPRREAVELAADSMPAWQFAHEYGNRWRSDEATRVLAGWDATVTDLGPTDPVCLGVDVAPDRGAAAIVACGGGTVEVVKAEPGVGWVDAEVRRLVERWNPAAVVADPSGPAVTVVEGLADLGERLMAVKAREVAAACAGVFDAVADGTFAHLTHQALDEAATGAERRALSGAWMFSRANGGHVLVAACLAHWADRRAVPGETWFVG